MAHALKAASTYRMTREQLFRRRSSLEELVVHGTEGARWEVHLTVEAK